jgi:uncharacterized protein (DUF302 family)
MSFDVHLATGFDQALARTRDALQGEGFGILTEIDLQAAFQEKLGRDFRRYRILGACNPPLAFAAVSSDPSIGLLLPCNVTVEEDPAGGTIIRLSDPSALLGMGTPSATLGEIAADARARLQRVQALLHEHRD